MNAIIHNDCLNICKQVNDNFVDLIIIDPPYLTTDEKWDKEEVVTESLIKELFRIAKPSCSLYCWCGIGESSQSLIRWFSIFSKLWKFKELITWKKCRGIGMRRGWLYTREEIMWFVKDNKQFIWNKEFQYSDEKRPWSLNKKGGGLINKSEYKRLTNVWTDITEPGYGSSPQKYSKIKGFHFTPKPQKAIERIILAHTQKNDTVFDCFVGSGTTAIVADKLNRQFIVGDNNGYYCRLLSEKLKLPFKT